jgi:hypothetical protein
VINGEKIVFGKGLVFEIIIQRKFQSLAFLIIESNGFVVFIDKL